MNKLTNIFIGVFGCFLFAWAGLIFIPSLQLGHLEPVTIEDTGEQVPKASSGLVDRGRQVYAANGCVYCHSQQVRPENKGSDLARGWGARRTVARDYINEKPPFLGSMRTGPDLSNIGRRQPSAEWHHRHHYAPRWVSPGSIMPAYAYLYKTQKIIGGGSVDALKLEAPYEPEEGFEVVPTEDAKALVAYLQSLDRSYPLKEAPEKQ
jgi:cytochrome c oxidase cbb3-type subunit II